MTANETVALTSAQRRSSANFIANRTQLATSQPALANVLLTPPHLEYVFGRDRYLTAFDSAGEWWFGCSLPRRTAAELLKSMSVTGAVACMLPPPHAAFVRSALDRLQSCQALIVLVPDAQELRFLLACDDFSPEIQSNRLRFASGPDWQSELTHLFENEPGLAVPAQFVRVPLGDFEATKSIIAAAEKVFAAANTRRVERAQKLRERYMRRTANMGRPRICAINRREFKLWDDSAFTLTSLLADDATVVDIDDPASSSPLALLTPAVECDAIVSADLSRAAYPGLLPTEVRWITWLTIPQIPDFAAAGINDRLILADPRWRHNAIEAGWPADRVTIAGWPDLPVLWKKSFVCDPPPPGNDAPLAMISDTVALNPPARLDDFSSHRLLWELIRTELSADPFVLNRGFSDPAAFLEKRQSAANIESHGFDSRLFIHDLIAPAYAQGIARLLIRGGVRLQLYGNGWSDLPEFAAHAAGAVLSRKQLIGAVGSASALIHAWPWTHAHPIDACGKHVVRGMSAGSDAMVRALKNAKQATGKPTRAEAAPVLTREAVEAIICYL